MEIPYEYYDGKLGFKLNFLMSDRNPHKDSLCLGKYKFWYDRMKSKTQSEQELRRACFAQDALILFSSLDRQTKDSITIKFGLPQTEVKKAWFAQHYMADRLAFDFYLAHTFDQDNKRLDLKYVEQYTYNASVLNTVVLMKANRKQYIRTLGATSIDIWDSLSKDVNAFREVAHNLPTTATSLRRKVSQYVNEGYACLISGKHCMKNAIKVKTDEQMALLDELLAKHTNLDNVQVCNLYNMVAERLQSAGWQTITPQTVANRKEKSNLVTFAGRNGVSALKNNLLMQNKRSQPTKPMLYWTMDGWDAELLYQKTATDKNGKTITTYHNRLTMVVVLDPFNKYPVGYAIGTHETPELIKAAMLDAILHTKELFGDYHKPFQLQTDHYSMKSLTPMYEACSKHFTPAEVKNAKSKVIEPYFGYFNKNYCQYENNWSGFGLTSNKKVQPNAEVLNKIRHFFPDEAGCRMQLENMIQKERAAKRNDYYSKWHDVEDDKKLPMSTENFLLALGNSTGYTNKLTGEGLKIKINGTAVFYDSFDSNFRQLQHIDWQIKYNPNNLHEAMAISPKGDYRFMLEQKYIQPMALAERTENDANELKRVTDNKKETIQYITDERQKNHETLEPLWQNPLLNDTLAKHLLVDSAGQHKNQRNDQRNLTANAQKLIAKQEKAIEKQVQKTWQDEQDEYINSKVDLTKYLEIA